jgi:heterodisulfide reductase subunit A
MSDSILVIGGGIAGINCAMNAAKYGTKVYLVDDTPSIGGMMARLDKTFPTNDCSICKWIIMKILKF